MVSSAIMKWLRIIEYFSGDYIHMSLLFDKMLARSSSPMMRVMIADHNGSMVRLNAHFMLKYIRLMRAP